MFMVHPKTAFPRPVASISGLQTFISIKAISVNNGVSMGLNGEGALYHHMVTFSFLIIIIVALKNANFNDLALSRDLTIDQVSTITAAAMVGALLSFIFLALRGMAIKEIPFGRAGSIGLGLIFVGVWGIAGTLGLDAFTGGNAEVGAEGILRIVAFSILPIFGSYLVCGVKFSTTRQDEAVSKMVREELQKAVASNNVLCPSCHGVISAHSAHCKYCGKDFGEPEEESQDVLIALGPAESEKYRPPPAPRSRPPAPSRGGSHPAPADDGFIFNCEKCAKKLKITNPKRPITIKCPSCETIATLTD
jgi:hypothetical protein